MKVNTMDLRVSEATVIDEISRGHGFTFNGSNYIKINHNQSKYYNCLKLPEDLDLQGDLEVCSIHTSSSVTPFNLTFVIS